MSASSVLRYVPLLGRLVTRPECLILNLPHELLLMIFERLTLLSKACFALTCKRLLAAFGAVLAHEAFDFPRLWITHEGIAEFHPWWRTRFGLLLRLQTGRWRGWQWGPWWQYCGQCLKLHPRHELLDLEYYLPPEVTRCKLPGIVVLCGCVTLNARKKILLIEKLETGKMKNPAHYHSCTERNRAGVSIDASIDISLSEMSELEVHARYDIRPGELPDLKPGRIPCCPHMFVFERLHPGPPRHRYCRRCQTTLDINCDDHQSSIQVTRNLGGKHYAAGRTWKNQCDARYKWIHV